jgi:hypothetical protein
MLWYSAGFATALQWVYVLKTFTSPLGAAVVLFNAKGLELSSRVYVISHASGNWLDSIKLRGVWPYVAIE